MKTLIIITLLFSTIIVNAQSKTDVDSKEVYSMIQKDKKVVILDVRTAEEFNSGHIKGAINIDMRQPDAIDKINKLNRNTKYIVYCRTSNRSGRAAEHMEQNGFKTIYHMTDGIMGWNQNNLPLEK